MLQQVAAVAGLGTHYVGDGEVGGHVERTGCIAFGVQVVAHGEKVERTSDVVDRPSLMGGEI